jgi:hypothetical protein
MTFSVEFQGYIGVRTLEPWATALRGLLPPWAKALRPDVVAHDARPLTRGVGRYVWATLGAHFWRHLAPRPTAFVPDAVCHNARCIFFLNLCGPYIFLQNHDKLNI